jgi:Tol biopolymer transport system component
MIHAARWKGVVLATLLASGLARAQTTERASVNTGGVQGNDVSTAPSISADGRFVAFGSGASNLVTGDTNGFFDIFVQDRQSGTTERVSVATNGAQGNSDSWFPSISGDGRFVAFESGASNLVTGDTNGFWDIFVRDRQLGTTERVNVGAGGAQGNSDSEFASISADGRVVVFRSYASNLVANDTNGLYDIFVRDRQQPIGTIELASVSTGGTQADAASRFSSISGDGRFVAFDSQASNLVAGDTNGSEDVFVRDRLSGTTERVSVDSAGAQGNLFSRTPSISSDGRFVAFCSWASDLIAADTNGELDIFVHDRQNGTTERMSEATGGAEADYWSQIPRISADGRVVSFHSFATNLVAGDTNGFIDVFVHDRQLGWTERVSVSSASVQANQYSTSFSSLSGDGRFVAFDSFASNLVAGDTNGALDTFLRDRGGLPMPIRFCFGDGSASACPCGNNGLPGRGCENSASTGGSALASVGNPSLASDTLLLTSSGELPSVLSIFLQGAAAIAAVNFGDGLRCASGPFKRLYALNASGGLVSAPPPGGPSISARSAALGDVITAGATRHYQTYYRDPVLTFCPSPPGNSWNVSSGLSVVWGQ